MANQAQGGPLAMISPSNTATTLTRLVPGVEVRADLEHLYPTGERNYVRTPVSSHLTAEPLARLAKERGLKRLFVSWDRNDSYWATFSADVPDAARHLDSRSPVRPRSTRRHATTTNSADVSRRPEPTGSYSRRTSLPTPAHCCAISVPLWAPGCR